MQRIRLDKIASATKNAALKYDTFIGDNIISEAGYIVAVRILSDKAVYNKLENVQGRMTRLKPGNIIAGVLGHRRALRGYAGDVPKELKVGDTLHVLNKGGVLGICSSYAPDVGEPFETEVIGAVLHFPHVGKRVGEPAHIGLNAIAPCEKLTFSAPIVAVIGTCMNAGKTMAACELVHGFTRRGLKVAAGKTTGVSLQRDILKMEDYGAQQIVSFMEAGIATTSAATAADAARRVIQELNRSNPDVIILELGDGLVGEYGVDAILACDDITAHIDNVVLCANDPVGAWGGQSLLKSDYNLKTDVITGPVTDNSVGTAYVEGKLDVPAANALTTPEKLIELVHRGVWS